MRIAISSHHFGDKAVSSEDSEPILSALKDAEFEISQGSATRLRKVILGLLFNLGWSDKTRIDSSNDITITSMKGDIALCLQTGNVSRFYADILKLQTLYIKDKASSAIYILPTKNAALRMGSNIVNFERFVEELNLYKHTITIPILIIGVE
ncbi:BglII/BstYI family type II restriction endonuclease [Paenibacillus septentrionalis]|uniref:BglII/BstYI family type II restriction endonuclease n=1 Tax=Paenibacillus septentrionalis TaxID=429342 RepID=A0ABW1VA02_9BACL